MDYKPKQMGIFLPKNETSYELKYEQIDPFLLARLSERQNPENFYNVVIDHLRQVDAQLNGINPFNPKNSEMPNITRIQQKELRESREFLEYLVYRLNCH